MNHSLGPGLPPICPALPARHPSVLARLPLSAPHPPLACGHPPTHALRAPLADADAIPVEALCIAFTRALDHLQLAGFDLSAFKLEGENVGDQVGWLRSRLDSALDYMDLLAGLP